MQTHADEGARRRGREATHVSRRRFLGGMSGAAGAVATGCAGGGSFLPSGGERDGDRDRDDRDDGREPRVTFGRMFPSLAPFAEASDALREAFVDIGRPGGLLDAGDDLAAGAAELITEPALRVNNPDNAEHTAGTTFLGQFVDHDLTFDASSPLGFATDPRRSRNSRTPVLDLDSLYGGGPVASPQLYERDRTRLRIESGGQFEDVPRDGDGRAILGDPRNDENLMVSGLHAAFIKFHNAVVDQLRADRRVRGRRVFTEARRRVRWHYQWIVLNELLPQMVGRPLLERVMRRRRYFRPRAAFMPVEFQGAAYRFGHSMVRPSYRANLAGDGGEPFFGLIFEPAAEGQADPVDLRGGARAPRRFVGWQTFFDFGDGEVKPNKRIDTKLSSPLFNLPLNAIASGDPPTSLPTRNLLRHITWSLPCGQDVAAAMRVPRLAPGDLSELQGYGIGLERRTPLWYYVLKEAEVIEDGLRLGPVGARIVAECIVGVVQLDPHSYASRRGWRPTLPTRDGTVTGDFRMVDLLTYAGVDPASRGQ
jgi:hypothetical protein